VVSYDWDAANNLTKLTWPDGFDVDYTWDANNRVTAAKDGSRILASVSYDALSRRQGVLYANGATAGFDYSARGDLTDHDLGFPAAGGNGPSAVAYDYGYNGVSQMVSRAISDPSYSWIPLTEGTDSYTVNGLNQYTGINGASPVYDGIRARRRADLYQHVGRCRRAAT